MKKKYVLRESIGMILLLTILFQGCGKNDIKEPPKVEKVSWLGYQCLLENQTSVDDNPWGYNICIIPDGDRNESMFMTPGTSFVLEDIDKDIPICLQGEIYDEVADGSDGLGLEVYLIAEGEIKREEKFDISNQEIFDVQFEKDDLKDVNSIRFVCTGGSGENFNADWLILSNSIGYFSKFGSDGYVKSVTYFGDEWPINFWNSELETLDNDFTQIKKDGFNSIILVIPWKEFQISVNPVKYNQYAFDSLDKVMDKANEYNLDVYARIGYSWDYYNDSKENITERYLDIMRDKTTKKAWLDYCNKMYQLLGDYPNFKEGFLTWEDFWGCIGICDVQDLEKRLEYSKTVGYGEWIKKNYSLEEYNNKYGTTYEDYDSIAIPLRTNPDMEAFYMFFDDYLNELLKKSQEKFPNISMEVRMDADLVTNINDELVYYSHDKTYRCENSDFTATMYGIPMGFENVGERVSAQDAKEHTQYILKKLADMNGRKPIYVEQFLYLDDTPQFSYNAQIKCEEVDDYLENISEVLSEYTGGYGIWTYKNYKSNMIYNSQFALLDAGWNYSGSPQFTEIESSNTCTISEGDVISQSIPSVRNHFPEDEYMVEFAVLSEAKCKLSIKVGSQEKIVDIIGPGRYVESFDSPDKFDIEFKSIKGNIIIDNLALYSFIQNGHLYDSEGNELDYIESIRILNSKL